MDFVDDYGPGAPLAEGYGGQGPLTLFAGPNL